MHEEHGDAWLVMGQIKCASILGNWMNPGKFVEQNLAASPPLFPYPLPTKRHRSKPIGL